SRSSIRWARQLSMQRRMNGAWLRVGMTNETFTARHDTSLRRRRGRAFLREIMSGRPMAMVTGAAGFIGGAVARALAAEGWEVAAAGRGTEHPALTHTALASLAPRLSLVVFCAGGSSVGRSIEAPLDDF